MGDEDAAEYLLRSRPEAFNQDGPSRPDLVDMTFTNQLLMRAIDELKAQNARLDAIGGVKPDPVRPMLRPLTGVERARQKIEQQQIQALIGEAYEAMNRYGVDNDVR